MLRYEIEGGSLPVVTCYPEMGQTLVTQSGAMCWMSPNMIMNTVSGGAKKAFGRLFAGESLFLNEFTAVGGDGMIAFASTFPGSILPVEVTPSAGIIVQKKSFLAMEKGLDLSVYFQKKFSHGFFGGEGFVMQRVSGDGLVFLEIDGYCKTLDLAENQYLMIDTGYLAAMSESCTMELRTVQGAKNIFFGGAGLFHTCVKGPGRVYLQSMPLSATANALIPYLPQDDSDGGGIRINLGN